MLVITSPPLAAVKSAMPSEKMSRMQTAVRTLLLGVGEDPDREGLVDTPKRVAKALLEATVGYSQRTDIVLNGALFYEPILQRCADAGMVLVRDINYASTSEATMLPFYGRCHVAYLPTAGVVLGLSKTARLVRQFSKRLQSPVGVATHVAEALQQHIACAGVAVVVEAFQLTSSSSPPESRAYACISGSFAESGGQWQELLSLLDLELLPPAAIRTLPMLSAAAAALLPDTPTLRLPGSAAAAAANSSCSTSSALAPGTPDASEGDVTPTASEAGGRAPLLGDDDEEQEDDGGAEGDAGMCAAPAPPAAAAAAVAAAAAGTSSSTPAPAIAATRSDMEAAARQLLVETGVDPLCQALQGTAARYVESLLASTSGYCQPLPLVPPARRAAAASASAGGAAEGPSTSAGCGAGCSACGCPGQAGRQLPGSLSPPLLPPSYSEILPWGPHSHAAWGPLAAAAAAAAVAAGVAGGGSTPAGGGGAELLASAFAADPNAPPLPGRGGCGCLPQAAGGLFSSASAGSGDLHQRLLLGTSPLQSFRLPFSSQCEHHMLPFHGSICVAVLPGPAGGTLAGRELAQVVSAFTRRLQIQERITHQVADAVSELLGGAAAGVLVMCDAVHMCMVARGVESHGGRTTTLASRGVFEHQPELRRQALRAWRAGGR